MGAPAFREKRDPMTDKTVSKRELVRLVADRAGVTIAVTGLVYDALLAEIIDQVRARSQVNLTGFGRFYPQLHKGHQAQFGAAGQGKLPDYKVMKFSASRKVGQLLAIGGATADGAHRPGCARRRGSTDLPDPAVLSSK